MEFDELFTSRLILRIFTEKTYELLFTRFSKKEIMQVLAIETNEDFEKEKAKFENGGHSTHNKKLLYFQLIDKKTKVILGWCGYHTWYLDHNRAEIGYGLTREADRGKGLMTEAIVPVIEYGFEQMKLNRIEAMLSPNNEPSLRLIQKMKFTQEGQLRAHYFHNEVMEDSLVFALFKSGYK